MDYFDVYGEEMGGYQRFIVVVFFNEERFLLGVSEEDTFLFLVPFNGGNNKFKRDIQLNRRLVARGSQARTFLN